MDRLVEVWSEQQEKCGTGFVVGARGVLTAGHVVQQSSRLQIRSADARSTRAWIDARICWQHPQLDIALLEITPGEGQAWAPPGDRSPPLAAVGPGELEAEAIGFPDAEVRPDGFRVPEQVSGKLLPGRAARDVNCLMAFDVGVSVPDQAELWKGFSGAAVHDREGRLVAIVAQADSGHQQRRLLALALEEAVSEGFAEAAARLGVVAVVEDRRAALWRANTVPGSLTPAGLPACAQALEDLSVFGVHAAVAADIGGRAFPAYLNRAHDQGLSQALRGAAEGEQRIVLVLGDSASGKSRSTVEALRRDAELSGRPLVMPAIDRGLARLLEGGIRLDGMALWLDDLDKYLSRGLDPDLLHKLLSDAADVVVLATMRRSQLVRRQNSLSDPAWDLLTDDERVRQVDLDAQLTDAEQNRARRMYANPRLFAALSHGVGLGEYLVGGPQLVKRLSLGSGVQRHLADTVIDWYRTGIQQPLAEAELRRLWTDTLPGPVASSFALLTDADQDERFTSACEWAREPIFQRDTYTAAMIRQLRSGYEPDDYLVDHVSRSVQRRAIPVALLAAAAEVARGSVAETRVERMWRVAIAAFDEERADEERAETAEPLLRDLVALGHPTAKFTLGGLLAIVRPDEALPMLDEALAQQSNQGISLHTIAQAMGTRAMCLSILKRPKEAVEASDEVISRFSEGTVAELPWIRAEVIRALVTKGDALISLSRSREALVALDDAITRTSLRYRGTGEEQVREAHARALISKGIALSDLDEVDQAIAALDEVVGWLAESPEIGPRRAAVSALVYKGFVCRQHDRPQEAQAAYADAIARFGDAQDPELCEGVARALYASGSALRQSHQPQAALERYDELIERFGGSSLPNLRAVVLPALLDKGYVLEQLDRKQAALEAYDGVLERLGSAHKPGEADFLAQSLYRKGVLLRALNELEPAIAAYSELVEKLQHYSEPGPREYVAWAMGQTGYALECLSKPAEALAAYQELVRRFGESPEPELRELLDDVRTATARLED